MLFIAKNLLYNTRSLSVCHFARKYWENINFLNYYLRWTFFTNINNYSKLKVLSLTLWSFDRILMGTAFISLLLFKINYRNFFYKEIYILVCWSVCHAKKYIYINLLRFVLVNVSSLFIFLETNRRGQKSWMVQI